ncbi:acyltransferase [Blastococcus sp. TML/M2B]|uniref:acyltransferase family protein n=2 Tax=unclassified Blastococcus TaxID=2619396 RepID=UPI001909AF66|nr:acyltransferase [Blastococcus sp. TML/M2B]MBN1093396.1 acyltransferase [Blastococcus sp. TML/M2B]
MTSGAPASTPDRRLGMLDVLRLLAALSVVAFHFTARNSPAWDGPVPDALAPVGQWAAYGRMGVPLFFVISGFVLLMSSWGRDVPGFVASRVARLYPAYWVAAAASIVLVLYVWPANPAFFDHEISTSQALLNLTMLQGAFGVHDVDGPYWTLWYEARFYLLIVLLMLVGITRRRILAFCALWPVAGALAAGSESRLLTAFLMPDYAPFFAGGMLLYLIHRDGSDTGTWLLVGLQGLFALNFAMGYYPVVLGLETPWAPSTALIALGTLACFGLVALVTLTPLAARSARWMTLAGALTYPLYLVHENLGWFVIHLLRGSVGPWVAVLAATVVALVAAAALHHLVERPFSGRLRAATLTMLRTTGRAGAADDARRRPAVPVPAPAAEPATVSFPALATGALPRHRGYGRSVQADSRPVMSSSAGASLGPPVFDASQPGPSCSSASRP